MNTHENARIGKIAALPLAVREEINQRILDGQLANQILPWLNDLPEVRQVLAERFNAKPVLRQNLSHWRAGGYQEWLRTRMHTAETSKLVDYSIQQAQARGVTLLESVTSMLAGQLLGVLSQMAEVMENSECGVRSAEFGDRGRGREGWEGEADAERLSSANAEVVDGEEYGGNEDFRKTPNIEHRRHGTEAKLEFTRERKETEADSCEKMALVERRLGLLGKATASLARLRRAEQGQEALRLQGERVAVMVEGNRIKRDKMALASTRQEQARRDETKEKQNRVLESIDGRPRGGGLSNEEILWAVEETGLFTPSQEYIDRMLKQGGSSKPRPRPPFAPLPPEAKREIEELKKRFGM